MGLSSRPHRMPDLAADPLHVWRSWGPGSSPARPPRAGGRSISTATSARSSSKNCFACHGPDEAHRAKAAPARPPRGGRRGAARAARSAIVPGDPDESELIAPDRPRRTRRCGCRRGRRANRLTPAEVELLRRWIAQGAAYAEHWAFVPPAGPAAPRGRRTASWPRNAIDSFVLARLEREGLAPSPEADRFTLLRRASLDLPGLPPTPRGGRRVRRRHRARRLREGRRPPPRRPGLRRALGADLARPGPLRRLGRLRHRPAAAEHLAVPRLGHRRLQPQHALRPVHHRAARRRPAARTPTLEQQIATAFHRNTMTNTEGGTDDEEFRVAAVMDRVDTTLQVWMGLTMGCAKCHNHKYDPITQEEYYQLLRHLQPDRRRRPAATKRPSLDLAPTTRSAGEAAPSDRRQGRRR